MDPEELLNRLASFEVAMEQRLQKLESYERTGWGGVSMPTKVGEVVALLERIQRGEFRLDIENLRNFVIRSPEAWDLDGYLTSNWLQRLSTALREDSGLNMRGLLEMDANRISVNLKQIIPKTWKQTFPKGKNESPQVYGAKKEN